MQSSYRLEKHEWVLGDPLGSGGYGHVYSANAEGIDGALKMVPKVPGAEREALFELPEARNVVPILDRGETEDHYIIVMPRAKCSLHDWLKQTNGPVAFKTAVEVLIDIAEALASIGDQAVHRDIKPGNILLLEERWCLADFGIARYVEDDTSTHTRKMAGSAQYTAPERWRSERAVPASDIYSLGVVAFEMLTGNRPFRGPSASDYRDQHLFGDPPEMNEVPVAIATLVEECLYKRPEARPTAANLVARLNTIMRSNPSPAFAKLQEANRREVRKIATEARATLMTQLENERRNELRDIAYRKVGKIITRLFNAAVEAAPLGVLSELPNEGVAFILGAGRLRYSGMHDSRDLAWHEAPFDVIAHAALIVRVGDDSDDLDYRGRSHAIYYCDAQEKGAFKWFEFAFGLATESERSIFPFAMVPDLQVARMLNQGSKATGIARPVVALEDGQLDEFVERWLCYLADAVSGSIARPRLPEGNPAGSWRIDGREP
ncbi:serine/threonine-protein kinase [Actinokineospora sp. 24-640]